MITPDRHGRVPVASISARLASICLITSGLLLVFTGAKVSAADQGQHVHQKPYALIFGTVWSPDGQPVYGIKVNIRRADQKKPLWDAYSDRNGEFGQRLPAGKADYVISSDLKGSHLPKGMKWQDATEVSVHIDNDERQDIGVHLR